MALEFMLAKPFNCDELKTYATGDVDTTDLQADMLTRFNTYKSLILADYPPDYSSAQPELTNLINDLLVMVNTGIPYSGVLDSIKANYQAEVASEGITYDCPECATNGIVPIYESDGITPTGTYKQSALCNGLGYTPQQYIVNPSQPKDFILAP